MADLTNSKDALAAILRAQFKARPIQPVDLNRLIVKATTPAKVVEVPAPADVPKPKFVLDWSKLNRPNVAEEVATPDSILEKSDESIEEERIESNDVDDLDAELRRLNDHAGDSVVPSILAGVTITLDPSQESAVRGLAVQQYGCLIGAAGTGKTTTTRHLLNTLIEGDAAAGINPLRIAGVDIAKYHDKAKDLSGGEDLEYEEDDVEEEWNDRIERDEETRAASTIPAIALVAFTGQATQVLKKNMPPSWRRNCMTIHSLLGFAPVIYSNGEGKNTMRFEPTYTKYNKMPWNVIIVDESSMVNVDLWHMLLDAASASCRFYFIGDLNQLPPPIGTGILGFALAKWPVFELTVVHRQADDAANRIVDTAWRILQGQKPEFDDPKTNTKWRVIGFELPHASADAHNQIIALAKGLSQKRVHPDANADEPFIYDPWRDRILTPTNGFNDEDPASLLGQFPLNDALSRLFANPDEPRVIIDAKKAVKKFSVGYRVMATKNEPPNAIDRVTNGLTGKIVHIERNPKWLGDVRLVGNEDDVIANRKRMTIDALTKKTPLDRANEMNAAIDESHDALDNLDLTALEHGETEEEEKQGGPCSHIVEVRFDNGAFRSYSLNAQVEQLQIAYASTTHKAQGAEMPTAIIVVHHGQKRMLCRENLYTAVTRASQRVIMLYTDFGLRIALTTQKVSGTTLAQKLVNYQRLLGEGDSNNGLKIMNVRLTHKD